MSVGQDSQKESKRGEDTASEVDKLEIRPKSVQAEWYIIYVDNQAEITAILTLDDKKQDNPKYYHSKTCFILKLRVDVGFRYMIQIVAIMQDRL